MLCINALLTTAQTRGTTAILQLLQNIFHSNLFFRFSLLTLHMQHYQGFFGKFANLCKLFFANLRICKYFVFTWTTQNEGSSCFVWTIFQPRVSLIAPHNQQC